MTPNIQSTPEDSVMVVEEMKHSWKTAIGRGNLGHPMNDKRRIHIERVHVVEFSMEGVYIGRNFGENPHYMVGTRLFTDKILPTCKLWGIPVTRYPKKKQIASSKIMCIWQGLSSPIDEKRHASASSIRTVQREFMNLRFEDAYEELSDDTCALYFEKENSSRGAKQKHYGYTSNNSLTRVMDENGNVSVRPSLIGGFVPPEWEKRFVAMTKIGNAMFEDTESAEIRDKGNLVDGIYGDSYRNECFASKINKDNKVEALTISVTSSPGPTLKIHMDRNNDETDNGVKGNYNYIICAWKLFTKTDGTIVRTAIIAYSRRSIADFFLRSDLCKAYTENHMTPWLSNLPSWKKKINITSDVFTLDYFEGSANSDSDGNIYFPPLLNKQATFLSSFADHILQFKEVYEKTTRMLMTVEKHLEIILPIVFCRTADTFCSTLSRWIMNKSSFEGFMESDINLTMSYMSTVLKANGSLGAGRYARHQPTFNIVPDQDWIRSTLLCLRETVMLSLHKKNYSFKMMSEKICTVKHVGPLLAQHLIHVMSLVGLVHPLFGAEARICEGTHTARRLQQKYSIPSSSHQSLLEFVSATYSWLPNIAENGVCKHEQLEDTRFRDVLYATQRSVMWVEQVEDSFRIAYVTRVSRKIRKDPGGRTFSRKVRGVFHGGTIPLETLETDKVNTGKTPWWYTLKKEETHILEKNRSYPKKRKTTAVMESRSKSARKTPPLLPGADSQTTVMPGHIVSIVEKPRPPDWLSINRKEMLRIVTQYEKDIKRRFMETPREGFGEGKNDLSTALRTVHAAGTHFVVPPRSKVPCSSVDRSNDSSCGGVHGETKGATHLLSMGIPVVPWNLFRAAEKAVIGNWMREHMCETESGSDFVVKFTVQSIRARSADLKCYGPTYFVSQATLMQKANGDIHICRNLSIPREVFGTNKGMLNEGTVQGEFYGVNKHFDQDTQSNEDNKFSFAFYSTFHAKISLMWYLLWNNAVPETWLPEYFPAHLWTSTKISNLPVPTPVDTRNGTRPEPTRYLLVTLQNGPKSTTNGSIFCTLIRTSTQGVWIRIEVGYGKTRRSIFLGKKNGGVFLLCHSDPFPASSVAPDRIVEAVSLPTDSTSAEGPVIPRVNSGKNTQTEYSVSTDCNINTQKEYSVSTECEIHVPFAIPTNGKVFLRDVLLVDPININDSEAFAQIASDLKRWRFVWGNVILQWKSTLLKRKSVEQSDKYWHPPGTGHNYRFIRSKPDLRKFLTLCCEEYSTTSVDSLTTEVDFLSAARAFSEL